MKKSREWPEGTAGFCCTRCGFEYTSIFNTEEVEKLLNRPGFYSCPCSGTNPNLCRELVKISGKRVTTGRLRGKKVPDERED